MESSLRTASQHNPHHWTLIVPIDHNDSELTWFDGLRSRYPFPLAWKGKTWLDDQMASFPDIRRYYIEGAADEVVSMWRELGLTTSGPLDARVGIERAQAIQSHLSEIDPHWDFRIVQGPTMAAQAVFPNAAFYREESDSAGPWTICLVPKNAMSIHDSPIRFSAILPTSSLCQEKRNCAERGRRSNLAFWKQWNSGPPESVPSCLVGSAASMRRQPSFSCLPKVPLQAIWTAASGASLLQVIHSDLYH